MTNPLSLTIDRLAQNRDTRAASAADRAREAAQTNADALGTFSAGTRVLDLLTGHEGVIEPGAAHLATSSRLVFVRLDRGDAVLRPPSDLLKRPTPPTV